jgi:hypothetical protein
MDGRSRVSGRRGAAGQVIARQGTVLAADFGAAISARAAVSTLTASTKATTGSITYSVTQVAALT